LAESDTKRNINKKRIIETKTELILKFRDIDDKIEQETLFEKR